MNSWRDHVRRVVPYTPGEQPNQPGMIKLNTNENPYPPAPEVIEALRNIETDKLRLYPDPASDILVEALADFYQLNKNQIFVGVGSDDVLAMAFQTFFNSGKPIFFPDITYSFYPVWADAFHIPYETKVLDKNFRIRREDYYGDNGGVIFPNPNAPTSVLEDLDFIRDILEHNRDVLVIIDEAYIDFGGTSALSLISDYDNLLIVQTFSKSRSMAGMRIGFAMGQPELIKALNDYKYSFNSYTMNQTALQFGAAVVRDRNYFEECVGKIVKTRAWAASAMRELGFEFNEPWANFIFVTHPEYSARVLFEALREEKIYVRYFSLPRIDNYLRVTIGTDAEMKKLIHFLREYMKK